MFLIRNLKKAIFTVDRLSQFVFVLLCLFPLLAGLVYALLYSLGLAGILGNGFTLKHWHAVFQDFTFWQSLFFSFLQALVGVLLTTFFALGVFVFLLKTRKEEKLPWFLFMPLIIAPIAIAFSFFSFWSDAGFVSRICHQLGLIDTIQAFPNVANGSSGIGILLAHLFLGVPFFVISYFNIYKTHNISSLNTLSQSMGSSKKQAILKVEIPILLSQSSRQMLLYFVFFFGAYEIPLLLGSESNRMFSILILDKLTKFDISQKPQAYVMTSFYLISMLIGFWLFLKPKRVSR